MLIVMCKWRRYSRSLKLIPRSCFKMRTCQISAHHVLPSFIKTPTTEARYIKTVVTNTIKSNLLCIFSPLGKFLTLCNLFMQAYWDMKLEYSAAVATGRTLISYFVLQALFWFTLEGVLSYITVCNYVFEQLQWKEIKSSYYQSVSKTNIYSSFSTTGIYLQLYFYDSWKHRS